MIKTKRYIFFILFFASIISYSQTLTQAKGMLEEGDCTGAIEILLEIVQSKPKDADASYNLGMAWLCEGNKHKAMEEFISAKNKGSRDANYQLALLELDKYEIENAEKYITEYRSALKKAKKGTVDLSADFDERFDKISSMLERVEAVIVIDSLTVDKDDFFKFYNIAQESGTLNSSAVLGKNSKAADPTVVFETGDHRERIWAIENDNHNFELVSSSALYGNEWNEAVPLGNNLNEGGDANYPFLMSDGVTLYFANDGENSLGGYDIFLTRRDGEEFLEPTNLGFPYNSLADDYMLAIDEVKNIGWWATNRNSGIDSVTIYTFIPSDMRINYSHADNRLASLARLDSYRDTWNDKDYETLAQRIRNSQHSKEVNRKTETNQFSIYIPKKGVYTSLNQFKNNRARSLAQQYIVATNQYIEKEQQLGMLRNNYRKNKSLSSNIIKLENELENLRSSLTTLKNEIIGLETK